MQFFQLERKLPSSTGKSNKTHQAVEGAQQSRREDLVEEEEEEAKLVLIKNFLPTQLSEDEIVAILKEAGITKGMNMGDTKKIAKPLLAGKTIISRIK